MNVLVYRSNRFYRKPVIGELLSQRNDIGATSKNPKKVRSYEWFLEVSYIS